LSWQADANSHKNNSQLFCIRVLEIKKVVIHGPLVIDDSCKRHRSPKGMVAPEPQRSACHPKGRKERSDWRTAQPLIGAGAEAIRLLRAYPHIHSLGIDPQRNLRFFFLLRGRFSFDVFQWFTRQKVSSWAGSCEESGGLR
jgi:hypothetical protein